VPPDEREELQWCAFRYAAGELTAAEAAAFESRLAHDQPARDALCRAVALAGRLASARPQSEPAAETGCVAPVAPGARSRRRMAAPTLRDLGWMAVGAAATLLIVYLARPGATGATAPAPPVVASKSDRPQPRADALVWARLQTVSGWAGEQSQRLADEFDWPLNSHDPDAPPPAPGLPSWLPLTQ
jgi:anti-sigma-K factor RskA